MSSPSQSAVGPATSRRRYDSSSRRARARATRSRIIEAAGELFVEQGFAGTSIREIAERAEISQETIYASFRSKAAVLMRWVDVKVAGDEEPIPVMERPWVEEMRREPSLERRLELMALHGTRITSRAAPALAVLRAAAASDPELGELLAEAQGRRREDAAAMLDLLIGDSSLRSGCDREQAVDWLWAVMSDELYNALVRDRGWSVDDYRTWLDFLIRTTLLEG